MFAHGPCLLLLLPVQGGAAHAESFRSIDRHALATPNRNGTVAWTVRSLTVHLIRPARNERDKVRAIFRWITHHIAYDLEAYRQGGTIDSRPETVLMLRRAVCEGYALLFEAMCKAAGVEVEVVRGFSKGYGHFRGEKISTNHAWNVVRIQGRWSLIDTTWGAGFVDGERYNRYFNDFYWCTSPSRLIFTHFPDETRWQMIRPEMTLNRFRTLPEVGYRVFVLGFTPNAILAAARKPGFRNLVGTFTPKEGTLQVLEGPVEGHLRAGTTYRFRIASPDVGKVYFVTEIGARELTRREGVFEGSVVAAGKSLALSHTLPGDDSGTYWSFLHYEVE